MNGAGDAKAAGPRAYTHSRARSYPEDGEVRTREVPEDDVPEEYQDRDNQV